MPAIPGAKEMIGVLTAAASDHEPTLSAYVAMLTTEELRLCLKTLSRYTVRVMFAAGQTPVDVLADAGMYIEENEEWERRFREEIEGGPPEDLSD